MTDRHTAFSRGGSNLSDTVKWLNVSGSSVPAYGVVQFRTNFASGYNQASQPDGEIGLYYVNGPVDVADESYGESLGWGQARLVLVEGSPTVGTVVGPTDGSWSMSEEGTGFIVMHQPVEGVGTVVQLGGGSGGGSSSGGCPCTCIDNGDLIVDDIETTSQWSVVMSAQTFKQTYGNIIFPAGTYVVEWDSGTSLWTLDIGADLTAEYLDGSDATADTTMDGTLTLEWAGVGSAPSLKLCVDGTVPAP